MESEIRQSREGKFMVVQIDPAECTWGECLAAAHRLHPGCKAFPCIAIKRPKSGLPVGIMVGKRTYQANFLEIETV